MLSIQPSVSRPTSKPSPQKVTPNLLPMRIAHNGPINATARFFTPTPTNSNNASATTTTSHAHFRGRHLHGTTIALPEGYTGAVLHITEKQLPRTQAHQHRQTVQNGRSDGSEEDEEEEQEGVDDTEAETAIAEQVGEFDEIVVWGHGGVVDEGGDMYVRGLREWVGFAESMHCEMEEQG